MTKILVLTYFDTHEGPITYFVAPRSCSEEDMSYINNLLDLKHKKIFFHKEGFYNSINLQFEVHNPEARGNQELLMISLVAYKEEADIHLYEEVVRWFVLQVQEIKDAHLGIRKINREKLEELENMFYSFYEFLPKETLITDRNAHVAIIGLPYSGKTSIIEAFKRLINQKIEDPSKATVKRLFVKNLHIITINLPITKFFENLWQYYLAKQDGVVFVIDISQDSKFEQVNEELLSLIKFIRNLELPLLIELNKVDLIKGEEREKILEKFEFNEKIYSNSKSFYVSTKNQEGLFESYLWLAEKLIEKIFKD